MYVSLVLFGGDWIVSDIRRDRVAVIGAGTAGLIAAKKLAGLGVDTAVYDQKEVLGYPARASGILSISGLSTLGIDYSRAVTNTLYGANIHIGKSVMGIRSAEPKAHILERQRLNEICFDEATASGADMSIGRRIAGPELDRLAASNIIIGADGAVSNVAKHFSMGQMNKYVLTYKAEFNTTVQDPSVVDLFFDNRTSKGLFGWACPNLKDVLEIGIGINSNYGNCKAVFDKFLANRYISEIIQNSKQISGYASIIPMTLRKTIVDEKNKVLLVGDAAGQVKSSTGGGIIYGGNASLIAAKVISEHITSGTDLKLYERLYRKRFLLDTRLHALINRIYSGFSTGSLEFLLGVMKGAGVGSFLGRYGDMDMPSLMLRRFFPFRTA